MSSSEQVPSTEWVSVRHGGEEIAEAWFMPEGGRVTVVFLVPRERLEVADAGPRVTVETLLEAAAIPADEVASWRLGDGSQPGGDDAGPGLNLPLPPPPADDPHLTVYVHLRPPAREAAGNESGELEIPREEWQALEVLWNTILGLEASINVSRSSLDGLRAELESAFRKVLPAEDKLHALQSDVVMWNKAKTRVHHAVPKAREFIHRATWAAALPERKELAEIYENHIQPRKPLPELGRVRERLEHLQKDRQILLATGTAVTQECRGVLAEIQSALSTLQRNAADRARQKRSAGREKGKHF